MSSWCTQINLTEDINLCADKKITISELSTRLVQKLKIISWPEKYKTSKQNIITEFQNLAKNEETSVEDFNFVMEKLYDLADTEIDKKNNVKLCWIETFKKEE